MGEDDRLIKHNLVVSNGEAKRMEACAISCVVGRWHGAQVSCGVA